jgi:DNA-binding protein H-NS
MSDTDTNDLIKALKLLDTPELKRVFAVVEIELLKRIRAEQSANVEELRTKADSIGYSVVLQKTVPKKPVGAKLGSKKSRPKYRNPETGETWSGIGRRPFWIENIINANGNLDDFLNAPNKRKPI